MPRGLARCYIPNSQRRLLPSRYYPSECLPCATESYAGEMSTEEGERGLPQEPSAPATEADRVTIGRAELEGLVASAVQRALEQRPTEPGTGSGKE